MIKSVVFDFGGGLIDWNPLNLYRDFFKNEDERDFFLQNVCTPEWNKALDKGFPFKEGVVQKMRAFPSFSNAIRAYDERWDEMLGDVIEQNVELLERVSRRYGVYGLTNWSTEKWAQTEPKHPFFKIFGGKIVVSGVEKEVKPDPKIFQILLDRYGLDARECAFIDDSEANVEAARRMGFTAFRFTDCRKLRDDLAAAGIVF